MQHETAGAACNVDGEPTLDNRQGQDADDDSERMLAYYAFPDEHWRHLRTTNIKDVELRSDPFAHQFLQTPTERDMGDASRVRGAA